MTGKKTFLQLVGDVNEGMLDAKIVTEASTRLWDKEASEKSAKKAIPILVRALQHHVESARACEGLSGALASISGGNDRLGRAVLEEQALPQLIETLSKHANDAGVCKQVSLALCTLALKGAKGGRDTARSKAIAAALEAVCDDNSKSMDAREKAGKVLQDMKSSEYIQARISDHF